MKQQASARNPSKGKRVTYETQSRAYRVKDFTALVLPRIADLKHTTPGRLIDMLIEEQARSLLPEDTVQELRQEAERMAQERFATAAENGRRTAS